MTISKTPAIARSLCFMIGLAVLLGSGSSARAAELSIDLSFRGGRAPATAYVAVVREDRPWSEPEAEEVLSLDAGSPGAGGASWSLPAGRYRVVAGAPGFETVYAPAVDLDRGDRRSQAVELRALVPAVGRVVGPDGEGVPGARVGRLRAFLDRFARRLSPRAEELLAANFVRRTDADGRFELPLHSSSGLFLFVEADGLAPAYLPNVRSGEPGALERIALSPGGSLRLRWNEGVGGPAALGLQLVPGGDVALGTLPAEGARAIWRRPLEGGTAFWPALPPGTYDVYAKGPSYAAHRMVPRRLGRYTVGREGRVEERLDLSILESSTAPSPEERVGRPGDATLLLPFASEGDLEDLMVVRWYEDHRTVVAVAEARPVSGGLRLDLRRACRPGALFLVETRTRIGTSGEVPAGGCRRPIPVDWEARADLTGRLLPPEGEALPKRVDLLVRRCPPVRLGEGDESLATLPVEPDATGRFESPLPAGCSEVAFAASWFAITDWAEVEVPPGETRETPVQRLSPGGSVLARVVSQADGLGIAGARVEAIPAVSCSPERIDLARTGATQGGSTPHAGTTSEHGWVRLYGLRPGTWSLSVAASDRMPQVGAQVEILGPDEVVVDPLWLHPPAALHVDIAPGAGLEGLELEALQIRAQRVDAGNARIVLDLVQTADGRDWVRFDEVSQGLWKLSGTAHLTSGERLRVGESEVLIDDPTEVRTTLPLDRPLFRGVVRFRGEPVAGRLDLYPEPRDDRRKASVRVDADGRFTAALDRGGRYSARVRSADGTIREGMVPHLVLDDPEREVVISLEGGRLQGRVHDSEGRPVADAIVRALGALEAPEPGGVRSVDDRRSRTDESGRFAFEAISAGVWTLTASRGDEASRAVEVALASDEERADFRLDLRSQSVVDLAVTGPDGRGWPGVVVQIQVPPEDPSRLPHVLREVTDDQGAVSLSFIEVPEGPVNVQLEAPNGLREARRATLRDGVTFQLGSGGGTLRMALPEALTGGGDPLWLVRDDGAFLNVRRGSQGAAVDAEGRATWVVPRIAEGVWRIVRTGSALEVYLLMTGQGGGLATLGDVEIHPGAQEALLVVPGERL